MRVERKRRRDERERKMEEARKKQYENGMSRLDRDKLLQVIRKVVLKHQGSNN